MEGEKEVRRQLQEMKKELKCWEAMFERKHGRKPNKDDIDQSPSEIKDTYRHYQRLKVGGIGGNKNAESAAPITPQTNEEHCTTASSSVRNAKDASSKEDEEVFGSHLNKPTETKEKSMKMTGGGERGSKDHPMWKLRKWTKDVGGSGYQTEVGGATDNNTTTEKGTYKTDGDLSKPDTIEKAVDVDQELKRLTLQINMKISQSPQKKQLSEKEEVPLMVVQQPRQRTSGVRLRLGHNLSSQWLQMCKPELPPPSQPEDEVVVGGAVCEKIEMCGETEDVDGFSDGGEEVLADLDGGEEEDMMDEEEVEEEEEEVEETHEEEEEGEGEEEELDCINRDFVRTSSEEEEEEGEYGGWGGQLQDVAEENIFNPATRHGDGSQMTSSSIRKSCSNLLNPTSSQSPTTSNPISFKISSRIAENGSKPSNCVSRLTNSVILESGNFEPETSIFKPPTTSTTGSEDGPHGISHVSSATKPSSSSGLGLLEMKETKTTATCSGKKQNIGNRWKLQDTKQPRPTLQREDTKPISSRGESSRPAASGRKVDDDSAPRKSIFKDSLLSEEAPSSPAYNGGPSSLAVAPAFSSNSVSENFVRLNMKVKRFSCKPGGISGSAYKRKMWKKAQRGRGGGGGGWGGGGGGGWGGGGRGGGSSACFKCGKPGHWAKNCTEGLGFKNLGCFAGEKVQFSETMDEEEKEMDREALQKLAKESPFPSTREAAMMARGVSLADSREGGRRENDSVGDDRGAASEPFQPLPPCRVRSPSPPAAMEPLFSTDQSTEVEEQMMSGLRQLGYQSFRAGQAEAVSRIICGVSTLLIQPTGSGKSLCYQLPAYLYSQRSSCITLVISPLVSLMEDQVRQFPTCLKGACLHTNQTQAQRQRVMADVGDGKVDVLLLSPEALVSGVFWRGWVRQLSSQLPPVAFACIDEAHCVSEWSHNFRPSYLRVQKVLKERLGVQCVLGLTATATRTTALSVASHLSVAKENIICGSTIPSNLHITASVDDNRDDALLQLLQSSRMRDCDSIIIYCTRQMETERVAQLIRTSLQFLPTPQPEPQPSKNDDKEDTAEEDGAIAGRKSSARGRKRTRVKGKTDQSGGKKSKKAKLECSVESYHAGMSAADRKRIQLAFMTGRLRMVVATVAFGMGLNKSDVRAIIHYNVPKSFESYVQEIGRAGRDGKPAYCHVFIDQQGSDLCELRRHAYSNTVDAYMVKHLVKKAFPNCRCSNSEETTPTDTDEDTRSPLPLGSPGRQCAGHEVSIPIENTVQSLDVKEECIQTLLCYLELQGWLEMKGITKDSCTLKCYGGPRQLRALSQKVPAVAAASARLVESGDCLDMQSSMTFSYIEVASSMGWESYILRSELRDLQFNDRSTSSRSTKNKASSDSSVLVEFTNPSVHLLSPGDMTPGELDFVCHHLQDKVKMQETLVVDKLHLLYSVLRSVAFQDIYEYFSDDEKTKLAQKRLMGLINDYFDDRLDCTTAAERGIAILKLPSKLPAELEAEISRDVYSLMSTHTERNFSGRTIARIFHGITSPCFPAEVWAKQKRFWRRYLSVDFNILCSIATKVTLEILHNHPN